MLKQWLNINATSLSNKSYEYIFEILYSKMHKNIYKNYFEQKKLNFNSEIFEDMNLWLISLVVPYGVTWRQIFMYKIYLEYLNKTYKFLRILYNLPVRKVRTHSLSNKKKWLNLLSISYCMKTVPLLKKLKLPKSKIQVLFFCEFINSVWFFNWWSDWFSAYKTRVKSVTKNPFIKWKYDTVGLQQGKAVFFNNKKKKTKHNRRKSVVLKNTYNIGFSYGFSKIYVKKILSAVTKKKC